jgi:hypothetical protein
MRERAGLQRIAGTMTVCWRDPSTRFSFLAIPA